MGCPSSTENGCRCGDHHPGLAEYARDPEAFLDALQRLVPVDTVEHFIPDPQDCVGGMTCPCDNCAQDRSTIRRHEVRQPWEPRRAA